MLQLQDPPSCACCIHNFTLEIAAIFQNVRRERLAVNKLSFPNNRSSYVRRLLTEYLTKDTAVSQKCQQNVSKIAQRHEYKLPSAAIKEHHGETGQDRLFLMGMPDFKDCISDIELLPVVW